LNAKHLAYVTAIETALGVADQIAGTGILQSFGAWGVLAAGVIHAGAFAYLHRNELTAAAAAGGAK
jgi:hypothetical protein